jgi:hypothetical protein
MLNKKICAIFCAICCTFEIQASACTLFAATGKKFVEGGGTIVAKNRDWYPGHQELKVIHPPKGNAYYGLFGGEKANFNAAGVNEKGLFVAMSTAGSIPSKERRAYTRFKSPEGLRTNEYLLRYYSSVDEVINTTEKIFVEPVNYIIADKTKVAYIEVGPNGKKAIRVQPAGILYHTNHYVEPTMLDLNKTIGLSSFTRFCRVGALLSEHQGKFNMDDFYTISQYKNDGPTRSIYRMGSKPDGEATVANFIVYLPPKGSPTVFVKYRAEATQQGQEKVTGKETLSNLLSQKI